MGSQAALHSSEELKSCEDLSQRRCHCLRQPGNYAVNALDPPLPSLLFPLTRRKPPTVWNDHCLVLPSNKSTTSYSYRSHVSKPNLAQIVAYQPSDALREVTFIFFFLNMVIIYPRRKPKKSKARKNKRKRKTEHKMEQEPLFFFLSCQVSVPYCGLSPMDPFPATLDPLRYCSAKGRTTGARDQCRDF